MLDSEATCLPSPRLNLDDSSIPRLPPPASARGHSRSRTTIDIPPLYSRSPSHSPTRSSTFLPFFNTSRSPSPRRTTSIARDAAEFSVDESDETQSQTQQRPRPGKVERIQSWFEGSSEPVTIGLVATPKKDLEDDEEEVSETMFSRSQESVPTVNTTTARPTMFMQSPNNSTSRFSFFWKAPTAKITTNPEELESLSVRDTLFPDGVPDEFTPAAFKNLQQNAEGALKTFQQAYRDSIHTVRKITSERDTQQDDLEASQTRNDHLRQQLLEMADRAAQQEKLIASLQTENEQMKANETALRSIRVITDHTSSGCSDIVSDQQRPRRNRSSDASCTDSIESGSTDQDSIFSENNDDGLSSVRSPGTSVGCPSPVQPIVKHACRVVTPNVHVSPQSQHLRSLTTNVMFAVPECDNCHGVRASQVWDVVNVMQAESAVLKERIQVLEKANESALDLALWMPRELNDINSRCSSMLSGRAGLSAMDDDIYRELDHDKESMRGCIV